MDFRSKQVDCPLYHRTQTVYTYLLPFPDGSLRYVCNGCEQCADCTACNACIKATQNAYADQES